MKTKNLILFGGTFDPFHSGHMAVAKYCKEHLVADKLTIIPAKRSPLKQEAPVADDEDRMKMISLAIHNEQDIELSDFEIKGSEPSYTINTVKHFIEINPGWLQVHWLVGVDSISELAHWYRIEKLIEICSLTIMYRGGFGEPDLSVLKGFLRDDYIKRLASNVIRTPLVEISSTEIRRRISQGEDVSEMLAPEVFDYIRQQGLYR